ncbi:hypothetical protein D3C81_1044230 [compost metagenome]
MADAQRPVAREQAVAVVAVLADQRGAGNGVQAGVRGEEAQHVEAGGARLHLLQGDQVCAQFRHHIRDALWHEMPIGAHPAVDVVAGHGDVGMQ